jgi:hypothetical protein
VTLDDPSAEDSRSLVVRVWLPDRPGALGQVASRIGSLRGDVTAIDILERGGGRVVDELVVSLPVAASERLLAQEIGAVDGVAVEHIRPVRFEREDPATAFLALAAEVAEAPPDDRCRVLCRAMTAALDADWTVVVGDGAVVEWHGDTRPEVDWVLAFVNGSHHLDGADPAGPGDVVWARAGRLTVAAGRSTRSFHERERDRIRLLGRILDALLR